MSGNLHSGHRDRVKQEFVDFGSKHFREHEMIELLLFYAIPRRDTNEIAHRLIKRFGSIHGILAASLDQLREVDGIGEHAAVLLKLCGDLVSRCGLEDHPVGTQLTSTEELGRYLLPRFWGEHEEVLLLVTLNNRLETIKDTVIARGTLTANAVDMQRILQQALRDGATHAVIAHNHPAGHAIPSKSDLEITTLAVSELLKIGVKLLDHIIVADSDFVSIAESNMLKSLFP